MSSQYSYSGFVDYTSNYNTAAIIWILIGVGIALGTLISVTPQLIIIIKNRSCFGLNPYFVFINSFAQLLNPTFNIIALRSPDFVGLIQVGLAKALPRMLTFINGFALWFLYLPVVCFCVIFFDKEPRQLRDEEKIRKEKKINFLFVAANFILSFILITAFIGLVFNYGFGSEKVMALGRACGIMSFVCVLFTWIPQIVTTLKLKDKGSLSLFLLALQAPGGTINSLFMMIGQSDDWSTWLATLIASIQMFVLLGIGIFFEIKKKKNMVKL